MQCAYCHLWPAPISKIFPHNLTKSTIFEKKNYWTHKVCFDSVYNFCPKQFSFSEEMSEMWSKMYVGLHVKCRLFDKHSNIKFHENPTRDSRVVPSGLTDMTQLIAAFWNFVKAVKNGRRFQQFHAHTRSVTKVLLVVQWFRHITL